MLWNILASHLQECCLGICPILLSVLCIVNMRFTHSFGNTKSNKKQDLTNRVSVLLLWFAFGWKTVSLMLVNGKVHCHDKEHTCKAKALLPQHTFSVKCSWMSMWDYWLAICSTGRCMVHNTFNPLALELDIYSLAHHLCKMWIFYEPRRVTLGNTWHFVEE